MIELYGNKIWNSNTPNKYKKVIIASEDSLDNICQELENSGLNYCAYIFNGEAHIAIGRATATNIDKLDIDYQTVIECNSKVYKTNNIIGTTTYDSIEDKLYRKYNTDFAYKIGQRLTEQGILFSGRIYGKTTTITVDKQYADTLNKISAELKEQRASFMSKSEVVQNESPEESKSVNEKISELHFNESQLSALAPSVKFIQTRNDDNLTDNFVSLFSDCTDFYESQLSALAEIYVDTYQSFSDKSLMFADTSRFNDLKQRFVNDNITAKLTENRGYSTTQLEIIREMVTYGMSESVINLLDYTFSIDEMQNFFTAYKNGSYEDLINLIADIKGTTRTDIEGQIEGGTYTPEIPDYDFLSKNLIFHNPSANHFTVMYFNPDSETGGQFVSTDINYNVAWRGNRDFTNDSERFWRYVEITGNQTLSDLDSKFFRESLNLFYSGEQIAEGLTADTQKLIADVATAEMIKSGELIEPESLLIEPESFDVTKFDTLISEQEVITSNNSDKNTIVINAFAGPGAGKTTSCLEIAEKLKKQGFVTEYVQEYAKELVYDNHLTMLDGHYEHQFAILNEQMKRINRLYGKVDFIVTDSPILLNNTYLNEDKNTKVYSAYTDCVNKLYGLYNNFNYFVERDTSAFEKEGRIHNLEQSIAIDNELKNMLHDNQIVFDVYTHATIDNIVRDSTIIYAKQLINSYCQDEFDSDADFSDLKKVGVAYTTTEDSRHTVEAVVNLVDYRLETYVDDKLFKEETYSSLKDMIDNCLYSLSFDVLVNLSDDELAQLEAPQEKDNTTIISATELSIQNNKRPNITCDWSESPVFENGKTYSVSEFDTLMKNADDEWVEQRQLEIEEYGSENAVAEAYRNGELDNIHLGYEKTKFIVNMPNGTTHTFRQDIGDGDGGVIDFLKQYPQYSGVVKILEADIKLDKGEIFAVPSYTGDEDYEYQTASEYLSGDIYAKLDMAKAYASVNGIYESNVVALKEVLPTPLKAGDIDINLGATWIDKKYYEQFMYEIFETPQSLKSDYVSRFFKSDRIELDYSEYSGRWNITNKRADLSVTTVKTYGASGLSAYQIFESVLNLSEPKVYKDKVDEYGVVERDKNNKPVRVLDVEATQVVQQKANAIRREFKNWIFKDANRRRDIVDTYNRTFNCIRPREYDGSHLRFPSMNSNIELHEHQKNAIAHAIYGGNTLFAHSVGAGKTFEMIATAMECKRLGLCHKSLFTVPNHLTEQVGADFLKLYPNANILVATKDDFKAENRKRLMSKIATGNYDAVIIGHTQLKMLPLSPERQEAFLQSQIDDIVAGLAEMKAQDGNKFTVKEMERTKKNLENQLEKLQSSKKDNTVYFEELGIDKLFVDEAHEFKNLYCATKLQNVSGISSRASQRATELFAKCRYLDEKTGGKGVVFATGTPLSNSVTELHTMMRYLNYDFLASHNNMQNFDNWISAFGVQKKEYELAPAGNKFKERTRIAEYSNLPELMSMFKMVADVKTAETLKLKVPDCELHIVDVEPTELQKELVDELSDRADEVNSGSVDPSQDNMLKITGDGRKLGLDPRLISPDFEDDPNTKLNVCVNNVFDIYTDTAKDKLTQIVFCDLGVPSKNTGNDSSKEQNDNKSVAELDSLEETGKFCVYDDIRDKLIAKGIPATEIAYIHNAKTEAQKSELFSKVRSGEVRILLGSTGKMGTGTNVQDRIIALHDLDVPWRPADLEQRRGRMVRQGNINEKVHLYRYVTKGTFDAYSYQLLETKQKFISQVMTDKAPARKCADVDQAALSYGEIKALCTGDDRIREKLTLDNRVKELNSLKADYNNTKYELEDAVAAYPEKRKQLLCTIGNIKSDIDNVKSFVDKDGKLICKLTLGSQTFNLKNDEERKNAAKALTTAVAQVRIADNRKKQVSVGNICGFDISVINNGNVYDDIVVTIKGKYSYSAQLGVSAVHNLSKIEGLLYKTESVLDYSQNSLNKLDLDYKTSVALLEKPFEYEAELQEKSARLSELTKILNIELAHQKTESKPKTHYFGKDKILGRNKSLKQIQNKAVMKSEPKRSEQEL